MRYDPTRERVVVGVRELCAAACTSADPPVPEAAGALLDGLCRADCGSVHREELCVPFDDGGTEYLLSCTPWGIAEGAAPGLGPTLLQYRAVTPSALRTSAALSVNTQLLLEAYILCTARGLEAVATRVTAAAPDGNGGSTVRTMERRHKRADLETTLRALWPFIRRRAEDERRRALQILPALNGLPFPHPSLRAGQKDLILSVCTACLKGRRLFAQAPTGIGKTVSVLYGAVRAMAAGRIRRIFYLTAKASTRREAFAAAGRIYQAGAGLRTVVLNAKDQTCPYAVQARKNGTDFVCDTEKCPLFKKYGERRGPALEHLLDNYHGFPASTVASAAESAAVCPYELTLDLSEYCDIIICDYNYAFDPGVHLRRYFDPDGTCAGEGDYVFLIDEAHNLTERARDIYSAVITQDELDRVKPFCEQEPRLGSAAAELDRALVSCKDLCADNVLKDEEGRESGWYFSSDPLPDLCAAVSRLREAAELFVRTHKNDPEAAAAVASLCRLCRKWEDASAFYDGKYRTYVEILKDRVSAKLYCLDPSGRLDEYLGRARSAVFFSATLTPSDYFADVLGGGREYQSISLPSPFPRENLFLAAVCSISTRYEDREKSARRIAAVIAATASARAGNYIVYFPSYGYMDTVLEKFRQKYPRVTLAVQRRGMTHREREEFLAFFKEDTGKLRIGFCVLGGSFSEGVDLPGSRLIGTVIVGVGLPGLSADRNIIRDYYENRIERGYDYAYTYPGMNNVLQAAGRVIRRDGDRGAVILVDDRYNTPQYRELMPPHWEGIRMITELAALPDALSRFWKDAPPPR